MWDLRSMAWPFKVLQVARVAKGTQAFETAGGAARRVFSGAHVRAGISDPAGARLDLTNHHRRLAGSELAGLASHRRHAASMDPGCRQGADGAEPDDESLVAGRTLREFARP